MHGGNVITNQDYEENISKIRVAMRRQSYVTKPYKDNGIFSLEDKELNNELPNLVNIAKSQRQENILNVIRHNDFNSGYKSNSNFKVLKNEAEDKLGIDYETQLKILIACEEDAEWRENLKEYWKVSENHPDFDEEKIVDDILARNFSFL